MSKDIKNRKNWFKAFKVIFCSRYKKTKHHYLGEEFPDGSFILSNHESKHGPMSLEVALNRKFTMVGTYEMNGKFKDLYRYQTRVFYHQKRGWNLHVARLYCCLASPLTYFFYKGAKLISSFPDSRFIMTIKNCLKKFKNGESVLIFPEDSSKGYFKVLKKIQPGCILIAETALKQGIDLPIVLSYYNHEKKTHFFDAPVKYSELKEKYPNKELLIEYILNRINELGTI